MNLTPDQLRAAADVVAAHGLRIISVGTPNRSGGLPTILLSESEMQLKGDHTIYTLHDWCPESSGGELRIIAANVDGFTIKAVQYRPVPAPFASDYADPIAPVLPNLDRAVAAEQDLA